MQRVGRYRSAAVRNLMRITSFWFWVGLFSGVTGAHARIAMRVGLPHLGGDRPVWSKRRRGTADGEKEAAAVPVLTPSTEAFSASAVATA